MHNRFGARVVEVELRLDEVVASSAGTRIAARPILQLGPRETSFFRSSFRPILGIGEPSQGERADLVVHLFESDSLIGDDAESKEDFLGQFFRRVLDLIIRKDFFPMKPTVRVIGVETLDAVTAGFGRPLMRRALADAGAHSVEFAASA